MYTSSPRRLAISTAILTSLITVGVVFGFYNYSHPNIFLSLIFIGLLVFLSVFLILFNTLNSFILHKLKPIYKTIKNINYSEELLKRNLEEKDFVKDVQTDVLHWAKIKTREIAQLKQLEKYRREFLGNVSHELKTPIFNIQGYVLTLLDGGLEDETINKLYLERAEKSVNRLISIVNDLESISRLESGELKLDIKKINIIHLFTEAFEEHEMLAHERSIKLKFKRDFSKSIYVLADRKRILEAVNNLLANSIKYGRNHGATTVNFIDMENVVLIEISDNGIGMSDKDLPRIFERFYRIDRSRSREMGGTGLGLAIVKHIIEAHNQIVSVRSELNIGTTFTFTLPKA